MYRAFIPQYYAERELPDGIPAEAPADPDIEAWLEMRGRHAGVPGAGREATLVDLALKNARQPAHRRRERSSGRCTGIDHPSRIEGFEYHAQGRSAVGSNVTFVDETPEMSEYRRKKLTDQNDDYANMRELLRWRATRAVEGRDDRPDPDLLLIDGGDGQLGAARDALAETGWDVPAIALAKDEELVITSDRVYDWNETPRICTSCNASVMRHTALLSSTTRRSATTFDVLDDVPGIGAETRKRLLRRFGSVDSVRAASAKS